MGGGGRRRLVFRCGSVVQKVIKFDAWGAEFKIWPSEIIGLAILIMGVWAFAHAQTDKRNPIDLAGMFVWPGTKHTSMAMFLAFWAGLIAFWVIIDMELKKSLTAETFLGFLAIFVGGKGMTEWINAWRNKNTPPSMTTERTEKTTVVAPKGDSA